MLFFLYTGPTGRPRDIPTRIYRKISSRYSDSVERPIPRVLPRVGMWEGISRPGNGRDGIGGKDP